MILLLGSSQCAITLFVKVLNEDVLQMGLLDKVLRLELSTDPEELNNEQFANSTLCLMHNGVVCYCFDDSRLSDLVIRYPSQCILQEWDFMWFAVMLVVHSDNEQQQVVSNPVYIRSKSCKPATCPNPFNQVTLVLPLALDDLSRAVVLFDSLTSAGSGVYELIVLVPGVEFDILQSLLMSMGAKLAFKVSVHSESLLMASPSDVEQHRAFPYAIQMSLKLLVARLVKTAYYITLDADLVLLRPFTTDALLVAATSGNSETLRGIYQFESQEVHRHWWVGSRSVLNFHPGTSSGKNMDRLTKSSVGFSVTPAVLSTFGSLLTVAHVLTSRDSASGAIKVAQHGLHCFNAYRTSLVREMLHRNFSNSEHCSAADLHFWAAMETEWITQFGVDNFVWSEYTLYRTSLETFYVRTRTP